MTLFPGLGSSTLKEAALVPWCLLHIYQASCLHRPLCGSPLLPIV